MIIPTPKIPHHQLVVKRELYFCSELRSSVHNLPLGSSGVLLGLTGSIISLTVPFLRPLHKWITTGKPTWLLCKLLDSSTAVLSCLHCRSLPRENSGATVTVHPHFMQQALILLRQPLCVSSFQVVGLIPCLLIILVPWKTLPVIDSLWWKAVNPLREEHTRRKNHCPLHQDHDFKRKVQKYLQS